MQFCSEVQNFTFCVWLFFSFFLTILYCLVLLCLHHRHLSCHHPTGSFNLPARVAFIIFISSFISSVVPQPAEQTIEVYRLYFPFSLAMSTAVQRKRECALDLFWEPPYEGGISQSDLDRIRCFWASERPHRRALLCNNWRLYISVPLGQGNTLFVLPCLNRHFSRWLNSTATLHLTGQLPEDQFAPCVCFVCYCLWVMSPLLTVSSLRGKAVVFLWLSNGCLTRELGVRRPRVSTLLYCSMTCG